MGNVLVLGGGGYVGCVLVEELLAKGYSVRVLDRLFFGRAPIAGFEDRIDLVVEDMRDLDERHLVDCDAVINVGGLSNDPTAEFDPRANHELNTLAAIRAGELAKAAGVTRLIFASTCSIYDRGVGEESDDVVLDETADVEPRAAYAISKLAAERALLEMADDGFAPVVFRKGTVFGFSPRMRYDLVVNTFVRDALASGTIAVHCGGSMWRPLIDVKEVARAYVAALGADAADIRGQVFNLAAGNFRVSELALRARRALRDAGVPCEVEVDYAYRLVRSYRVASDKVQRVLGFVPRVSVEESIGHMVEQIRTHGFTDFSNPRYENIAWFRLLEETVDIVRSHGYALHKPEWDPGSAGAPLLGRAPLAEPGAVGPAGGRREPTAPPVA